MQLFLYLHLDLDIPAVILFEHSPLVGSMLRKVPCPAAVDLRGPARSTEKPDEIFAFSHLPVLQFQHFTDCIQ